MLQLLVLSTLATISLAQNTTCYPIDPKDNQCGVFTGMQNVLYLNQADELKNQYGALLGTFCDGMNKPEVQQDLPSLFCLGSMGICYGATFRLPRVKDNGVPEDLKEVGRFYSEAQLGQLMKGFEKEGVTPPCYELCDTAIREIKSCSGLQPLGISPNGIDTCAGFPKFDASKPNACIRKLGPKVAPTDSAPKNETEQAKPADPAKASEKKGNGSSIISIMGTLLFVVLLLN